MKKEPQKNVDNIDDNSTPLTWRGEPVTLENYKDYENSSEYEEDMRKYLENNIDFLASKSARLARLRSVYSDLNLSRQERNDIQDEMEVLENDISSAVGLIKMHSSVDLDLDYGSNPTTKPRRRRRRSRDAS